MHKVQISPGVNITVDSLEFEILKYMKNSKMLDYNKLNSGSKRAINRLLSKGLVTRSKKGDHVSIRIYRKVLIPEDQ